MPEYTTFPDRDTEITLFEGPEKTLRVYFETDSLLTIQERQWQKILDTVKCKILSSKRTSDVHTYVLSESSLLVYKNFLILKTCGTTTLINGLPGIIELVGRNPQAVIYSRRGYFYPEKQCLPHGCWKSEVHKLRECLGAKNSTAMSFGDSPKWQIFFHINEVPQINCTEMMMTGLQPSIDFSMRADDLSVISLDSNCPSAEDDKKVAEKMTLDSGIHEIIDENLDSQLELLIDDHAFYPCGYSCNAIIQQRHTEDDYFTIHVTPEEACSYASFETNASVSRQSISNVLNIFKPQESTLVLINNTTTTLEFDNYLVEELGSFNLVTDNQFDLKVIKLVKLC
ncbi:adenosylmethionine decarboxylase [Starmerella bacillaris]|uniref:Adenosylmethionine decarboxylase n=1 Tax=Starmerella bacillaris TaxID=1247836 RepID=A0AAV5RFM3_STABA|nr:adenosylmethionine decarboxylase [Starmerella bacillaris]